MAERERMQWKGRFEFLFTSFGYTIGLGNIWRFPELCYRNGGGAFLFPYMLTVALYSIPMVFLEMSLGQFTSEGPIRMWKMSPIFIGVGWARMFVLCVTSIYYVILIMYSFYYMLVTFVNIGGSLPWEDCNESNFKCATDGGNTSAEDSYWNRFVLGEHESDGLNDLGPVVGRNLCLLLLMWIIVYYCCVRGIRSIAKVIYVTATFPFGLILILLVRGMTLEGYEDGLEYYLSADWSRLGEMKIWSSAANQAIYSTGIAFGCHIALSSHNAFRNNIHVEAIVIVVVNTVTSFVLGLVVFSFIGHASHELNIPIEDTIQHGPGMLFITYIQGLTRLPGSSVWSVLFFLTVFTLGLDSLIVQVWTTHSTIHDSFPKLSRRVNYWILIGLCAVLFLLGIPLVTKGGIHLMVLMDRYIADIGMAAMVVCQCISVCWVYGLNNFIRDLEMMIGRKPNYFWWYWKGTWMITVPVISLFIFIASCVGYEPSSYRGKVIPPGGEVIGWLIIVTPLVAIIVGAVVQIKRYGGVKAAMRKTKSWGPRCAVDRFGPYATQSNINIDSISRQFSLDLEQRQQHQVMSNQSFDLQFDNGLPRSESSQSQRGGFSKVSGAVSDHGSRSMVTAPKSNLDTSINEAPPKPHLFTTRHLQNEAEGSDPGEQLPGNGYITPISKCPVPDVPCFTDSCESSLDT